MFFLASKILGNLNFICHLRVLHPFFFNFDWGGASPSNLAMGLAEGKPWGENSYQQEQFHPYPENSLNKLNWVRLG